MLEKVKAGINKSLVSANVNVSTFLEIEKVKAKIGKEKTGIQNSLNELGKHVFESWKMDSLDLSELIEKCQEIHLKEKLINDLQKEAEDIEAEKLRLLAKEKENASDSKIRCQRCRALNFIHSRFCIQCGAALSDDPKEEDKEDKVCSCGAVCNHTAKFCTVCGKAL